MTYRITPEAEGAWRLRSSVTKEPIELANYKRYIPSFLISGTFRSRFVAVGIRVTASGENWRFGGFLAQDFDFNSSGYREANRAFFCTKELLINNVTVLELPVITDRPYRLRYFPPTWFRDLTLQIWEYTGTVTGDLGNGSPNVSAELQEIKNLLNAGFSNLNDRLDREDIPTKLINISLRLARIEEKLNSNSGGGQLTTQTREGRLFFFS